MPKLPINYSNTIIYKLVCLDLTIEACYVGHTTNFANRKRGHKTACNNENGKDYNIKVYKFIREHGGWINWDMIMIETYDCKNQMEACKYERNHYEIENSSLNDMLPYATHKESVHNWESKNKEYLKQHKKEYRQSNQEHICKQKKEYREKNKELIKEKNKIYTAGHKEQQKEYGKKYREKNKEIIKEKNKIYTAGHKEQKKEYNEKNKEIINEKNKRYCADRKEQITCGCGASVCNLNIPRHNRTKKHMLWVNKNSK